MRNFSTRDYDGDVGGGNPLSCAAVAASSDAAAAADAECKKRLQQQSRQLDFKTTSDSEDERRRTIYHEVQSLITAASAALADRLANKEKGAGNRGLISAAVH